MHIICYYRMKLKEIKRTAIQAWSPAQQHPIYLAAGNSTHLQALAIIH